jgi:hypothetical protein
MRAAAAHAMTRGSRDAEERFDRETRFPAARASGTLSGMEPLATVGAMKALAALPLLLFLPLVIATLLAPLRVQSRRRRSPE